MLPRLESFDQLIELIAVVALAIATIFRNKSGNSNSLHYNYDNSSKETYVEDDEDDKDD